MSELKCLNCTCKEKQIVQTWQNVRMMWVFSYVDEFVDVCLDFSIAQYMEDCSLINIQKDFAHSDKKKNISQTY